nr:tetratricopeptide repeat protein [uncultured Gellertiella sp.]
MAFNDDSFIREVNEELRSDQFRGAWKRYGKAVIALAAFIVIGTAGERTYAWWSSSQASVSGDRFLAAIDLAKASKPDEALAAFSALEKDGFGAYPVLARMRAAALKAEKGDKAGAVADFSAIGKDGTIPPAIQDVAHLRAAWLLSETGTYPDVSAEVEALTATTNPLRHSAREVLGVAAYHGGDVKRAKEWFTAIANDPETPRNVGRRASMMLDVIAASGKAP